MRRLLLFLALAAAAGCGSKKPLVMGAAPPAGRIVYQDPSIAPGVSGAVGEVVYLNGGTSAWVKTGTNNTDWQRFPTTETALQIFTIPVSDLTATGTFYTFNSTAISGKKFELLLSRVVIVTTGGTLSGNGSFAIAQNGADISSAVTVFTSAVNGTTTRPSNIAFQVTPITDVDMTSLPLQLHIITGLSGNTATGFVVIAGWYY